MTETFYNNDSVRFTIFKEKGYIIKKLTEKKDKIQAYKLRHRVFSLELNWVSSTENELEIDSYDEKAVFIGVFDIENKLVAFLRLVLPPSPFMIEDTFILLIDSEHKIRKETDTVEVSRLCVAPNARNNIIYGDFGIYNISMLLYKGVYHWSIRHKIRYLYLVVEYKFYKLLCIKGFPCKLIGKPKIMPDKIIAVAAIMDWLEFEMLNSIKNPIMLKWFSQYQLAPALRQSQQLASDLLHQVSA